MKWSRISGKTALSKHFKFYEYLRGHDPSYLDKQNLSPDKLTAVITVAEMARERMSELIGRENGIIISSGVRTPTSNRGASGSIHMLPPDSDGRARGVACDFKPVGGWSVISYEEFYGCFVWALSKISEHFGLGYYPETYAGIHVDSAFELRESQCLNYEHAFPGHRWGQNYSWRGNQAMLKSLNRKYSHREPWKCFI